MRAFDTRHLTKSTHFQAFIAEQNKDVDVNKPPWSNAGEQTTNMKKQVLSLSLDSRNFVRAPPAGSSFVFDMTMYERQAAAVIEEDPNLKKMRFQLVPKV